MSTRRTLFLMAPALALTLFWLSRLALPQREIGWPPGPIQPALRSSDAAPGVGPYVGVAGCASPGCHHANGPQGSKGSEFSTWIAHDPHARAYSVLLGERSRRMASRLWPDEPGRSVHPEREALCLGCHAAPAPAVRFSLNALEGGRHVALARHRDGVGCEACHGPAQEWVSLHSTPQWAVLTANRKRELGFVEMKDLRVRAETCARCHVGQGSRDVDHDLIAAGHPRLRFELGVYLSSYPRHWDQGAELVRHPDYQARVWLIGQLVSARAALELLASRAEGAASAGRPWPEFAEYACAACHHDLTLQGQPAARRVGARAGDLRWGPWPVELLADLTRLAPGGPVRIDSTKLRQFMQTRLPPEQAVATEARRVARAITNALAAVERTPAESSPWLGLLHGLADTRGAAEQARHWDALAQRYLGLAALHTGLLDLDRFHAQRVPELATALEELRQRLERAFPGGADSLYGTPGNFDSDPIEQGFRTVRAPLR